LLEDNFSVRRQDTKREVEIARTDTDTTGLYWYWTERLVGIQRCQMNFFKSARSDVKIRQNPPRRIGQIRQKSARNWDDFRPFFTLRLVFVAFLVRILPYLRISQREIFIAFFWFCLIFFRIFIYFEIIFNFFYQLIFL
jgi:hypothetical protein